jgi:plastocyanin/mono/diheme cytochrome c family protein
MTDTPGREPEQRLPARREPSEPAPADRFTAPPSAHRFELSPERAAKIVRQSSNARWVGFLTVIVVVLFTMIYYFYELGAPLGLTEARLEAEGQHQQVVAVERGYNLYQANCARCHGPNGLGPEEPETPPGAAYIGPKLNDDVKLYQHLSADYLQNVLEVGGRYVCGNAKSQMPVWSDENGGPLNYRQIEELIAFIRAPSDQESEVRDPALNEPTGDHFKGWRDPNYRPEPGATPYPACWVDAVAGGGGGGGSPAPSVDPAATTVEVTASGNAFEPKELTAPAGEAFAIKMSNQDSIVHDVDIRRPGGEVVANNDPMTGEVTYSIPALEAGEYEFFCQVHPIPAMTGTLTVE